MPDINDMLGWGGSLSEKKKKRILRRVADDRGLLVVSFEAEACRTEGGL